MGDPGAGAIIVDPAGVITAVARERGVRPLINVEPLIEQTLIPLIVHVLSVFAAAGVSGRLLCDVHARGFGGVLLQAMNQGSVQMPTGTRRSQPHGINGTAGTDEIRATAKRLIADVATAAGLLTFA